MGLGDKIANKAEELGGKAKAVVGDLTDHERLEAEGHALEASAHAKQGVEDVKDGVKDAVDKVGDGLKHAAYSVEDAVDRKL